MTTAIATSTNLRLGRRSGGRGWPIASLVALPAVIALWEVITAVGIVSSTVLPTPADVASGIAHSVTPGAHYQLFQDAGATLERLLIGTAVAAVAGIPIGVALGARKSLRALAQPLLVTGLTLPALALAPLYMAFFGLGQAVTLAVVIVEAIIPIIVTVSTGYRTIPAHVLWVSKSLGARRSLRWRSVILPALTAPIVSGLRTGMGYAWRSLLAVEGITALKHGLGYRIFQAGQFFDTRGVFVDVVTVAVIGVVLETLILGKVEKRTLVRWGMARA